MNVIYRLFILLFTSFLLVSCDNFMDIHKEYIEGGEIIYAPKPDSVSFIAGREQILFRGWVYNGVNVEKVIVKWNNGNDSLIIPVQFNTGMDSIEVMLTNMEEKSYTFQVYTIDNYGHHSLILTDFGSSYGDVYASSLMDRRIKSVGLTDVNGTIEWFSAPEGIIYNEVRYTQSSGDLLVTRVPNTEFSTVLTPRPAANSEFEYRSLYIPESESVDTFYTAWVKHADLFPATFPYDKVNWSVVSFSDHKPSDGGGVGTILDNNLDSFWHSEWQPDMPLPHWAIVDMESPKKIAYFDIYRRKGNTDTKTVQLFASNDSDPDSPDWVLIGEGVFTSGDKMTIQAISDFEGRYLKVYLPDSNRAPFTSVAEIYVFGN